MFDFWILGINARNLRYIKKYNSKSGILLADNKIKTKQVMSRFWIPVAQTFSVIKNQKELKNFSLESIKQKKCIIKPNKWSQGKGVWIIEKKEDGYTLNGENIVSEETIFRHMRNILDGAYSMYGFYDQVLIEEVLSPHHDFVEFCEFWLADIRIIVFNSVPIAAMIRLPTKVSRWKANLAQGGVGFWINISTGQINSFLFKGKIFSEWFPSAYNDFENKKIPHWDTILMYSSKLQSKIDLWYLALDWMVAKSGPKLLEINARAGLEIQNITGIPLTSRLQRIENIKIDSYKKGISIAHSLFWGNFQTVIDTSNTLYLSQLGTLKVGGKQGGIHIPVNVTTHLSHSLTKISHNLAQIIGKHHFILSIDATSMRFQDLLFEIIEDPKSSNEIQLGTKDMVNFIIKPLHRYQTIERYFDGDQYSKTREIDKEINMCGKGLNLSFILKPTNFEEELSLFQEKNWKYNPQFTYAFPHEEVIETIRGGLLQAKEKLKELDRQNKMYHLFEEKLDELFTKLWLLVAYKNQDFVLIDSLQKKLYGEFNVSLFELAKKKIEIRNVGEKKSFLLGKILTEQEVISKLKEGLITYGIPEVPIVKDDKNTARISIITGRDASIHIQENAQFYEKEMDSLVAHEIWVHLRRFINGTKSWLRILKHGTWYYLEDEEGLAIYNSLRYLPEGYEKNEMYIKYYLVCIAHTYNFSELAERIRTYYPDVSNENIFSRVLRLKKWLCDTSLEGRSGTVYEKDKIYLQWYMKIKKWIEQGGYIENMLVWKIKTQDIDNLSSF